jgi:iron(III) transport system permease protein
MEITGVEIASRPTDSGSRASDPSPVDRSSVGRQLVVLAIGICFAMPAVVVLWRTVRAETPFVEILPDLLSPLWRTIQLAVLVSATCAVLGTGLAWLLVRTDLPGRRFWRLVLVLPLALPSFVGAAAFITGLAPSGLLYEALDIVGITPPRRLRGLGITWLVLTAFTYPYVLLPVSARFASVRPGLEESARMLGDPPWRAFVRVTLPQLRPAILGGSLLVFLYCVSDFGAVQLLGYDTLTRVIFATRLVDRSTSFAAASVLVVLAIGVVALERSQRRGSGRDRTAGAIAPRQVRLGWWRLPALLSCFIVLFIALVTPIVSLGVWARRGVAAGRVDLGDLVEPARNTAFVAVLAAIVAVVVVLPVARATTRFRSRAADVAGGSIVVGFAMPGLVTALALAVVTLNTPILRPLYQSLALLVFAYVVHFGSQALASTEQSMRAVPDGLRESSRLLEPSAVRRVFRVDLPLMMPGLLAASGLVLLATVKELPATLLLSPIEFSTLATKVWGAYEDGFYAEAGAASLALVALSAVLTWFLVLRRSELVGGRR